MNKPELSLFPMETTLPNAVKILKQGGIIIFPTDTAYGMGCRVDDAAAVKRLFTIRKRVETKAVPVLVGSRQMARKYWQSPLPSSIEDLMQQHWSGGLTIIYTAAPNRFAPLVLGGGTTVGLRMPNHEIPLGLIHGVGVPIIGTSANFAGGGTPYSFEELDKDLVKPVDGVVRGECGGNKSSTVVDCTVTPMKILREGIIKL